MYEEAFKNIDDVFWKDAGCSSELDYIEQTSWILFLKYLDDYEDEKETAAILNGETYERIIDKEFRWKEWAYPKTFDGKLNYDIALTGDDLLEFVNKELFPHLAGFKQSADNPRSIDYKIGEIFSELRNKLQSGYSLRDVINKVNDLKFLSNEEKHELSSLYEDKIKNMGNAGRNGGEYYTPRPLIKSIVKVINPQIGETVYDGAVGSAGFLCEAFDYMSKSKQLNSSEYQQLQDNTFYGKEKKSLAYVIGIMNMILHGVEAPNIIHKNTLTENLADIQQNERVDVILANPPFGGKERTEIQQNFPIKTSETAYLFLQHFIKMLKPKGRCGVIIKNTFLSNLDNPCVALRKQLISECNLFAILDLPKVFGKAGVKTVVLFFQKSIPTEKIWYYKLNVGRNIGLKYPLNDNDMEDFFNCFEEESITLNSWTKNINEVDKITCDLSVENPNFVEEEDARTTNEIILEIKKLQKQSENLMHEIIGKV